jgi:hypothetical protein
MKEISGALETKLLSHCCRAVRFAFGKKCEWTSPTWRSETSQTLPFAPILKRSSKFEPFQSLVRIHWNFRRETDTVQLLWKFPSTPAVRKFVECQKRFICTSFFTQLNSSTILIFLGYDFIILIIDIEYITRTCDQPGACLCSSPLPPLSPFPASLCYSNHKFQTCLMTSIKLKFDFRKVLSRTRKVCPEYIAVVTSPVKPSFTDLNTNFEDARKLHNTFNTFTQTASK